MGKALYRRYRGKSFDEIIGQEHITKTLANAVKNQHISHAYLLTGPRGVGKTSVARILAHAINDLDYSDDAQHLDIIEIDAASNRRIDEIRDLREKSRLAPTSAKYKVYIIDEVHMLTKEAFNALLKTLEEPPAHVIFILATTELHKLPATIISRTQRFAFKPISEHDLITHLRNIANKEKILIDDEALGLIATHASGGFRDAISLLDQIKSVDDKISASSVEMVLGRPSELIITGLLNDIIDGRPLQVYEKLEELYQNGFSTPIIAESLIRVGQKKLQESNSLKLLNLLEELLKIEQSKHQNVALEVAINKILISDGINQVKDSAPKLQSTKSADKVKSSETSSVDTKIKKIKKPEELKDVAVSDLFEDFDEKWKKILDSIKSTHNTLYGILNNAVSKYSSDDEAVVLSFRYPFHLKKVSEQKNQEIIKSAILEHTKKRLGLVLNKMSKESTSPKKTVNASKNQSSEIVSTVLGVFGGGEIVK